jgi:hypothetical protein
MLMCVLRLTATDEPRKSRDRRADERLDVRERLTGLKAPCT